MENTINCGVMCGRPFGGTAVIINKAQCSRVIAFLRATQNNSQ